MADHFHKKGEWMVSLRVTNMEMKKNILNGKSISNDEVLKVDYDYEKFKQEFEKEMDRRRNK